jgi:hypothetical protein
MEWKEALPLLQENHTAVAISVTPKGRAQATVALGGCARWQDRVRLADARRQAQEHPTDSASDCHRHQARHPALR